MAEEDRHVPMEVEIVGPDFDVLLQRSGRQELLYVLKHRNIEYRLRLVARVRLLKTPYRFRRKPNREPQDTRLSYQP